MTPTHITDEYGTRRVLAKGCVHYWHMTPQTTEGCVECAHCGGEEPFWRVMTGLLKALQDDPIQLAKLREALK